MITEVWKAITVRSGGQISPLYAQVVIDAAITEALETKLSLLQLAQNKQVKLINDIHCGNLTTLKDFPTIGGDIFDRFRQFVETMVGSKDMTAEEIKKLTDVAFAKAE
jgi:hypothetical protein